MVCEGDMAVSYTHLDVYKRQGFQPNQAVRYGRAKAEISGAARKGRKAWRFRPYGSGRGHGRFRTADKGLSLIHI